MSLRSYFGNLVRTVREEYRKVEVSDKILDLVSISGVILFLIGLIALDLMHQFNIINIIFIIFPLLLAGIAASFRMKRRDKPEETPKLFKEWVIVLGGYLLIALIVIILAFVLIKG